MAFEINLPSHVGAFVLRTSGLDATSYSSWNVDRLGKKSKLPTVFETRYLLMDNPVPARMTVIAVGADTKLEIAVENPVVEVKLREHLTRYSAENRGSTVIEAERVKHWDRFNEILKSHNLSYDEIRAGAVMPRPLIDHLIEFSRETVFYWKDNIRDLFSTRTVAKADRVFAARWLVTEFEKTLDPCDQTSMRIWELAVPEIGDDLVRLIQDNRYGSNRAPLCMALAKIKHSRATDVIVSLLDQPCMAWAGLRALAKLKAVACVNQIRKFLRHPDSEVRFQAKKALKKLGFPVEKPVPPIHLVKNKKSMPPGIEEWSSNLDMDDLKSTLDALTRCVQSGFGPTEVAEVIGVAEEARHNQTKAFCFPVMAGGQTSEVWLSIFMDDIDSPDLAIYAAPEVIAQLNKELPPRE